MKQNDLTHLQDVLWYDGELISVYDHPETGELYLRYWLDVVGKTVNTFELWVNKPSKEVKLERNVWLTLPIKASAALELVYGRLTILDALNSNDHKCFIDFGDEFEEIDVRDISVENLPDVGAKLSRKPISVGDLVDSFEFTVPTYENLSKYQFEIKSALSQKVVSADGAVYELENDNTHIHLECALGYISNKGLRAEGEPEKCELFVWSGDLDRNITLVKRYVQDEINAVRGELLLKLDGLDILEREVDRFK